MRSRQLLAALVGLAAIAFITANASAYYHPTTGRFLQRDPGSGGPTRVGAAAPATGGQFAQRDPVGNQYADGMNLYEYVRSAPVNASDPMGLLSDFGAFRQMGFHWASFNGNSPFIRSGGEWAEFVKGLAGWRRDAKLKMTLKAVELWKEKVLKGPYTIPKHLMFLNGFWTTYVLNGVQYKISGDFEIDRSKCTVTFSNNKHVVTDTADPDGFKDYMIHAAEFYGKYGVWWIIMLPSNRKPFQRFPVEINWETDPVVFILTSEGGPGKERGGWPVGT